MAGDILDYTQGLLIITGGSRGIGAAIATQAGRRGYSVCVNFLRNELAAKSVVEEIKKAGGRAIAVRADVGSEPDVTELFKRASEELGPITALVNNAATLEAQMRLDGMDVERLRRTFATNVIGTMLCARHAVLRMSTRYGGTYRQHLVRCFAIWFSW